MNAIPKPCAICKGACCEGVVYPSSHLDGDGLRWLGMRGLIVPGGVYLRCPCRHLADGACAIHPTRPQVCREYRVGGVDCRAAVLRYDRQEAMFAACNSANRLRARVESVLLPP